MQNYIVKSINDGIALRKELLDDSQMLDKIGEVASLIYKALMNGNKVLLCGNGGSAADAQHIAAELVGRFIMERKGLPAIALSTDTSILTAVGNDYGYEAVFERQVEALASAGDILIGISTSGKSKNIRNALLKAQELGVITIGLLGGSGGECRDYCAYSFIVSSTESARVQELHITIGHILCGIVDSLISGNE